MDHDSRRFILKRYRLRDGVLVRTMAPKRFPFAVYLKYAMHETTVDVVKISPLVVLFVIIFTWLIYAATKHMPDIRDYEFVERWVYVGAGCIVTLLFGLTLILCRCLAKRAGKCANIIMLISVDFTIVWRQSSMRALWPPRTPLAEKCGIGRIATRLLIIYARFSKIMFGNFDQNSLIFVQLKMQREKEHTKVCSHYKHYFHHPVTLVKPLVQLLFFFQALYAAGAFYMTFRSSVPPIMPVLYAATILCNLIITPFLLRDYVKAAVRNGFLLYIISNLYFLVLSRPHRSLLCRQSVAEASAARGEVCTHRQASTWRLSIFYSRCGIPCE